MKKTLLCTALVLAVASAHAVDSPATQELTPIVVTATRTPVSLDDVLSATTLISRDDIERLQPVSLVDLLQGLPGINLVQAGGVGEQTSLFMRGTNSDHVLLLIDGVRIGSVSAGLPALEEIPVNQIDHIEIVRGPRSSLYGSDAIGGVIQIVTRHGQTDGGLVPSLSLTTGNRDFNAGQFGLSGGDSHAWYNLSLGGEYTSGFPACRMGAAEVGAACYVDDPRDDAYRNWNGAANGGYRWDNGTELDLNWLRSKSNVEYTGSPYGGDQAVEEQEVAGAKLSFAPLDPWKVSLSVGQSRDRSTTYYQGSYYGDYYPRTPAGYVYSRRNQASWQNDVTLAPGQLLTAGVDYQQEHLGSDTGYLRSNLGDTGGFLQYQGSFGRNEVQLSARRDHNDQFDNHNTGAAAWGYHFDHGLHLAVSYGSAFHAPTFNDLYYPPYGGIPTDNPDLKPETSHSAEIDLTQQGQGWNWGLSAYQTRISQLITLNEDYVPFNIDRARIRGFEAQGGTVIDDWNVQGYLTVLQPLDKGGDAYTGNLLPRRPRRTARIDADRQLGAFTLGASVNAASYSYDDLANQHRLGGYSTVDLRASYAFAPAWSVQLRVANIFEHHYETAYYYNQPGRSWFLTLRYAPAAH